MIYNNNVNKNKQGVKMKKLLFVFGLILTVQSAFAVNPDSPIGKAFIRKATLICVKESISEDLLSYEYAYKMCTCVERKVVSAVTVQELKKYGEDDPEVEKKFDKLIDKFMDQCLEELSK